MLECSIEMMMMMYSTIAIFRIIYLIYPANKRLFLNFFSLTHGVNSRVFHTLF